MSEVENKDNSMDLLIASLKSSNLMDLPDFIKVSEFQFWVSLHTELATSEDTTPERHSFSKTKETPPSSSSSSSLKSLPPSLDSPLIPLTPSEEE